MRCRRADSPDRNQAFDSIPWALERLRALLDNYLSPHGPAVATLRQLAAQGRPLHLDVSQLLAQCRRQFGYALSLPPLSVHAPRTHRSLQLAAQTATVTDGATWAVDLAISQLTQALLPSSVFASCADTVGAAGDLLAWVDCPRAKQVRLDHRLDKCILGLASVLWQVLYDDLAHQIASVPVAEQIGETSEEEPIAG